MVSFDVMNTGNAEGKEASPVVEPGTFDVMFGGSSKDIKLQGKFEVII